MKKLLSLLILAFVASNIYATQFTIGVQGLTYNPALVQAFVGDTVHFEITSNHPTVQVAPATWLANGTDELAGGFGTHTSNFTIVLTEADVPGISYVCANHVASGMKGVIQVTSTVDITEATETSVSFGPNPVYDQQLNYSLSNADIATFSIYSITGQLAKSIEVTEKEGVINLDLIPGNYILQIRKKNGELIKTARLNIQ